MAGATGDCVKCGICHVTQIKTKEKDGYSAIQIGADMRKEKFRALKEFKTENSEFKKEIRFQWIFCGWRQD